MLKLLSSFVLFSAFVFPQEMDSLLNQNIQTLPDTNFVEISDTSAVSDTIVTTKVKADTLIPIQGIPLTDVSTIIRKRTFLFDQYRYTGDLFRSFSLNFTKDLGFIGYPNETFIYGVGNRGISYLQDGVFLNNRYTNSLDLNLVQSENIDSIEIVPSPRGFLYGPYNNPVTVNFITRDFLPPAPYARVRYYEGPDGEAMIVLTIGSPYMYPNSLAGQWTSFQLDTNNVPDVQGLISNGNATTLSTGDNIWIQPGVKDALYDQTNQPSIENFYAGDDIYFPYVNAIFSDVTHSQVSIDGFIGFHIICAGKGCDGTPYDPNPAQNNEKIIVGCFTTAPASGGPVGPHYGPLDRCRLC